MLISIDLKYTWVRVPYRDCSSYIQTDGKVLLDMELAKYACLKDKNCKAVSLSNCNKRSINGLCKEQDISETMQGNCIYKKGKKKVFSS